MTRSAHRRLLLMGWLAFAGCSDDTSGTGGTGGASAGGMDAGGASSGGTDQGGAAATSKRVFVTSATYMGDLGGLEGGDLKCQDLADAERLGGTWLAWLSETPINGDPNPPGPATRFTQSAAPYVLVGGEQIAPDWAGLIDGSIDLPIDHDETGEAIGDVTPFAWTGTNSMGAGVSPCCENWTNSNTGSGYGSTAAVDETWSFASGQSCTEVLRLYCFEQ